MKFTLPIGLCLFILGLHLAFIQHSAVWFSPYTIGGFLIFESINARRGFSLLRYPRNFVLVWLLFILVTIAVELTGNYWLNLVNYPSLGIPEYVVHVIFIAYAFTGFFSLTLLVSLHNVFTSKRQRMIVLPIAAFLFGYVNEYPNTFAHEWVYVNWPLGEVLGVPILVSILWIAWLVVLPLKRFFLPV